LVANPYQSDVTAAATGAPGVKPNNFLVQSILVTLCCCLPLGIVGIVYAAQVDGKWNSGDFQGAIEASQNANKWSKIGLITGIVLNLLMIGAQVLIGVMAAQQQGQLN